MTQPRATRVAFLVLLAVGPGTKAVAQLADKNVPHGPFGEALGVACTHCHVEGQWAADQKAPFAIARNMVRMVAALNGGLLATTGGVTCLTCHRGQARPARLPRASWEAVAAQWPPALAKESEERRLAMAVYTASLGVTCDYCHVSSDWAAGEKRPHAMVTTMSALFEEFPKYMPATARTQCFMCHQGQARPLR